MSVTITEVISFYHELDLLEAHLEESSRWADRILVIESDKTFTGQSKPLLFEENKERFARFNVEHLITPSEIFKDIPVQWTEEGDDHKYKNYRRYNRNINRQYHWENVRNGTDYVYLNDVDEFISHTRADLLKDFIKEKDICYVEVKTRLFNYFVNARSKRQAQHRIARSDMPEFVMNREVSRGTPPVELGWHFTDCFKDYMDYWHKAVGISIHSGVPVGSLPSPEEMRDRVRVQNRHPWFPNHETRRPLTGAAELMSLEDRSWAPLLMQEKPELFPWADPNDLPFEFGIGDSKGWYLGAVGDDKDIFT